MSKSLGNYVGIAEPAGEQFGKLMSISDAQMPDLLPVHDRLAARAGRRGRRRSWSGRAASQRGQAAARPDRRRPVPRRGGGGGGRSRVRPGVQGARRPRRRARRARSPAGAPRRCSRWLVEAGLASSNREAVRAIEGGRSGSTASGSPTTGCWPPRRSTAAGAPGRDAGSGPGSTWTALRLDSHCLTRAPRIASLPPRPARRFVPRSLEGPGTTGAG